LAIQGHLFIQVDVEFAALHDQFPAPGPQQFSGLQKGQMGEFISEGSHGGPPVVIESVRPSIAFYPSICNFSGLDAICFETASLKGPAGYIHGFFKKGWTMMADNYMKLARKNLDRLFGHLPDDLEYRLPAENTGFDYTFTAFGQACVIAPEGITLDGVEAPGVIGILLSLYALNATADLPVLDPLRAFKEFPFSAPYVGAFASHTEQILVPAVHRIKTKTALIIETLSGETAPASVGGDFAFVVRPLPKIFLCYIFYEADEEFPPSATCLYSSNANRFMPVDGLADVGEYTSKRILDLAG
jgi:hypothetical protein